MKIILVHTLKHCTEINAGFQLPQLKGLTDPCKLDSSLGLAKPPLLGVFGGPFHSLKFPFGDPLKPGARGKFPPLLPIPYGRSRGLEWLLKTRKCLINRIPLEK